MLSLLPKKVNVFGRSKFDEEFGDEETKEELRSIAADEKEIEDDGEQSTIPLQLGDPGITLGTNSFLWSTRNEAIPSNE